ncbi:hypothetical protein B0H14DRAFT_579076 [Mycena olivaceomarginata]|nr:hypothetical protein B0H14DRAFT_579076 [Mycena olivaceomarginata]
MGQALEVLETLLRQYSGPSSYTDQSGMTSDVRKKLTLLEQCSEAVDLASFARHDLNVCGRKQTTKQLSSRFIEALKLLLEALLFDCLSFKGDFRVTIKHARGTEDVVRDSGRDAVAANKRKVFLPVNVVGMKVALHFYTRGAIFGEKTVAAFETQLIVPGDSHHMHEIRFARCNATLQLSLMEELSTVRVAEVRQREATEALAVASGGMDKIARCTGDLRFFVDLAVAGSEVSSFAKAGFAVAKLAFDKLNEVSGTHKAFAKVSHKCGNYIEIISGMGDVFSSRLVQDKLREAMVAIIGALERIVRHYEQTLIKVRSFKCRRGGGPLARAGAASDCAELHASD